METMSTAGPAGLYTTSARPYESLIAFLQGSTDHWGLAITAAVQVRRMKESMVVAQNVRPPDPRFSFRVLRPSVSWRLPTEATNRDVLAEYSPKQRPIHEEGENSPAREPNDL